jgi:hypothetical protein
MSRALFSLLLITIVLAAGCDCSGPSSTPCTNDFDCGDGYVCRDSVCAARPDASHLDGGSGDAASCPPALSCGDACCEVGQICGGGACCATSELCGGVCCGADQACQADRCVLDCGERASCGSGADALCCDAGDVCYLGACTTPGASCARNSDCADGQYCESTVMRCLPRAMGTACEYHPPIGMLELAEEWSWTGDDSVLPTHQQVMMAPMVANLTDDDGDGDIDVDDIPDVVFHTFTGSNYWSDGVLRAVSGADGARIWPAADPGYRTTPGGEVAIADVDPSSPGPEILACSPSNQNVTPNAPGYLMMIAADGTLLRSFDTAPNDVPCGFDAPMVGDSRTGSSTRPTPCSRT